MPALRKKEKSKHLVQQTLFGIPSSSESRSSPVKSPHKRKRAPTPSSEEEPDSDEVHARKARLRRPGSSRSEDSNKPVASPRKRPWRTQRVVSDKESSNAESDSPVAMRPGKTAKSRGKMKAAAIDLTEDDDETMSSGRSVRRRLIKGVRPSSPSTAATYDNEISSDEVDSEKIIEERFRTRGKKTAFQKNLEKLKRKKQRKSSVLSESEQGSDDEEASEKESQAIIMGAKPTDEYASNESDSVEGGSVASDGFIVEDEGPSTTALPAAFSMEARQDLAHHFKRIFQFFVHVAVRPPNERHDFMEEQMKSQEYFSIPLQVARRKITGLRDSLVASSMWRAQYKKALETYATFELVLMDYAIPGCDACHMAGRKSSRMGRVLPPRYDPLGFATIPESDGEDDDDSDSQDSDKVTPKEEFRLGRFCARRTKVYHSMCHWEYSLFVSILNEVDELRRSTRNGRKQFVRVAHSHGRAPPEDLTDADGICDWLDDRRFIEVQWQNVKELMERARHLEVPRGQMQNREDD